MSEREEFEKWVDCDLIDNGHPLEIAWLAWQAARRTVSGQEEKPIAWLIDWPDEPELGHYFAEEPVGEGYGRSRPLVFAAPIPATEQEKP